MWGRLENSLRGSLKTRGSRIGSLLSMWGCLETERIPVGLGRGGSVRRKKAGGGLLREFRIFSSWRFRWITLGSKIMQKMRFILIGAHTRKNLTRQLICKIFGKSYLYWSVSIFPRMFDLPRFSSWPAHPFSFWWRISIISWYSSFQIFHRRAHGFLETKNNVRSVAIKHCSFTY